MLIRDSIANVRVNKILDLDNIIETLSTPGGPCEYGCAEVELHNYWKKALVLAGYKKDVIAVSDWIWCDMILADEKKYSVIKANNVVDTNTRRFDCGDWVRTSALVKLHDNCLFETMNTIYILIGNGTRKNVDKSILRFF